MVEFHVAGVRYVSYGFARFCLEGVAVYCVEADDYGGYCDSCAQYFVAKLRTIAEHATDYSREKSHDDAVHIGITLFKVLISLLCLSGICHFSC